jgi:hypothetical protein
VKSAFGVKKATNRPSCELPAGFIEYVLIGGCKEYVIYCSPSIRDKRSLTTVEKYGREMESGGTIVDIRFGRSNGTELESI